MLPVYVKVPAERPSDGSFVTPALVAGAGILAALAITPLLPGFATSTEHESRTDGSSAYSSVFAVWIDGGGPLIDSRPGLAAAVLAVAAILTLWACVRVARVPAGTPPATAPGLAAAGLAVGLVPWMAFGALGFDEGIWEQASAGFRDAAFGLPGWMVLGWLGWVLVAAGLLLALAAHRPRPPLAVVVVPVLAAGAIVAGWLAFGATDGFTLVPGPAAILVVLVLSTAFVLSWRRSSTEARPAGERGAARAACLVLAGTALLPWTSPLFAAWWPGTEETPWPLVLVAAGVGAAGMRGAPGGAIRLLSAGSVAAIVTVAIVRALDEAPSSPGAYVAAAAAALVCAVLLRRPERGGTL